MHVLRSRLQPLVERVLEHYGASDSVPAGAIVDAVVDGLLSRPKRTFLTARQAILRESNGSPRCWICNLLIPLDAPTFLRELAQA